MKNKLLILLTSCAFIFSCNEKDAPRATTDIDTGRDFIRATLNGDFKSAERLLYNDSVNNQMFESYKRSYDKMPNDKKEAYKKASYTINTFETINDSTRIIDYSNSYMNQATKIKLVKKQNLWSVDFKYTTGDTSSIK